MFLHLCALSVFLAFCSYFLIPNISKTTFHHDASVLQHSLVLHNVQNLKTSSEWSPPKLIFPSYLCFSPEGSLQCTWLCAHPTLTLSCICTYIFSTSPPDLGSKQAFRVRFKPHPITRLSCTLLRIIHSPPWPLHDFHSICIILLPVRPWLCIILPPNHEYPQQQLCLVFRIFVNLCIVLVCRY